MYVVTVTFEIHFDHLDEFRIAIMSQAANSLKLETGCHQFDVCFDLENPQLCFLYEKYDDRAAFDQHLCSDHFRNFDQVVKPWIEAKDVCTWVNAD